MAGWLDKYFSAVVRYLDTNLPMRGILEFVGSGVAATDETLEDGTPVTRITFTGAGEANTTSNVGDGAGQLAKAKAGVNLPFKTIKAGANVTVTNNDDDVTVSAAGPGPSPNGTSGQFLTSNGSGGFDTPITPPAGALVGTTATQTLTGKEIVLASNTLTDTSAASGDIPVHNGTRFVRQAKGSNNTYWGVNGAGAVGYYTIAFSQVSGQVNLATQVTGTLAGGNVQAASSSNAGSMSASDKDKLNGMQPQGAAATVSPSLAVVNWEVASVWKLTTTGNTPVSFANAASGRMVVVRVTAGGAHTVTWPTVKWAGGTPPTQTPSGTDVYTFIHDGTDIYGSVVQDLS